MAVMSCRRTRRIGPENRLWTLWCAGLLAFGLILAGGAYAEAQTPVGGQAPSGAEPAPTPASLLEQLMALSSDPTSKVLYVAFYVALFVAIVGVGVIVRRIAVMARKRAQARRGWTEDEEAGWSEETTLTSDSAEDEIAEIAQALADLDQYQVDADAWTPPPAPAAGSAPAIVPGGNALPELLISTPGEDAPPKPAAARSSDVQQKALESWLRRATTEDVEELMREGMRLARDRGKAEAYDVFSTVTRLKPDHVSAWLWKAGTALHPQEAIRCLQKALELEPENAQAIHGLAWALGKLAEVEESELGALPE